MELAITPGLTGTDRFEFRLSSELKSFISEAAALLGVDTSEFVRQAIAQQAGAVLAERETKTLVPAEYYVELLAELDQPVTYNSALLQAMERSRHRISRD
jgi:uncharacterized protein (DUF1778 family)